jgi:hypothetical protein
MGFLKKLGKQLSQVAGGHSGRTSQANRATQEASNALNSISSNMMREQQESIAAMKRQEDQINTMHGIGQKRLEASQARALRGRSKSAQFSEDATPTNPLSPRLG